MSDASGTLNGRQQRVLLTSTRRIIISCDVRTIALCFTIIGVIATFGIAITLVSQYLVPTVTKDLRHRSDVVSRGGGRAGAVAASRKAADVYRSLMRLGMVQ